MEEIIINDKQIQEIADRTAAIVLHRLKDEPGDTPVYVSVKEAARIIGVSVSHMYKIRDEYPHIRRGNNQQGHIFFIRESLMASLPTSNINNK